MEKLTSGLTLNWLVLPPVPGSSVVYIKMQKHVRIVEQVEWEPRIVTSPLAA